VLNMEEAREEKGKGKGEGKDDQEEREGMIPDNWFSCFKSDEGSPGLEKGDIQRKRGREQPGGGEGEDWGKGARIQESSSLSPQGTKRGAIPKGATKDDYTMHQT